MAPLQGSWAPGLGSFRRALPGLVGSRAAGSTRGAGTRPQRCPALPLPPGSKHFKVFGILGSFPRLWLSAPSPAETAPGQSDGEEVAEPLVEPVSAAGAAPLTNTAGSSTQISAKSCVGEHVPCGAGAGSPQSRCVCGRAVRQLWHLCSEHQTGQWPEEQEERVFL